MSAGFHARFGAVSQNGGEMKKSKLLEVTEELRKLQKPIHNANVRHKESLNLLEKFAVKLTDHVGSIGFFFIIFGWTVFWLG